MSKVRKCVGTLRTGCDGQPGVTGKKYFCEVFSRPPDERGLGADAVSYEELRRLYHMGSSYREVLFELVSAINAGDFCPEAAELLGDNFLFALEKPDGGTRPIGVGAALRRLAGRVVMRQLEQEIREVFTTTAVPAEMLEAAGHDPDRRCNVPLQLGCCTPGGAEILISMSRLALSADHRWAVLSDDKKNGFNAISRSSIFAGLRRWFPQLIPCARLFYSRAARLYTSGKLGRTPARDEDGEEFFSMKGCTQGDALGPFFFAIGYHMALLETQAAHPDVAIWAYLDDTYYLQVPAMALAAMRTGTERTLEICAVASNLKKQEAFSYGDSLDLATHVR